MYVTIDNPIVRGTFFFPKKNGPSFEKKNGPRTICYLRVALLYVKTDNPIVRGLLTTTTGCLQHI